MKVNWLIVLTFLLFFTSGISANESFTALDSLYILSVADFYQKAEMTKNQIWEGMELGPVCLFRINGPALLYNHPNPPGNFVKLSDKLYIGKQKNLELFGATQREINGTLTAIIDYGHSRYSNAEEAYAELFHELHHVHQRISVSQSGFDNPAVLLKYPENYLNDGLKLYEQKLLLKLCFSHNDTTFRHLLNQFYSCRQTRKQIIGDFSDYEESVENMEGPAFFCEYKFFDQVAAVDEVVKKHYNQKHFFSILTTPYYGRDNLRTRHLAAGLAMCIILDRKYENWQQEFYAKDESLYEFFISKFKPQEEPLEIDSMYFELSKFHTDQEIKKHQSSLDKFYSQQGIKIILQYNHFPQFNGFDPMNAEAVNDSIILHKTMLRLSAPEQNHLFVTSNEVLTFVDREVWKVSKLVLFAPAEEIGIADDKITVDYSGKNISWRGNLKWKTEKEILFFCE